MLMPWFNWQFCMYIYNLIFMPFFAFNFRQYFCIVNCYAVIQFLD